MESIQAVQCYWEHHPLLAHEVGEANAGERWEYLDHIKQTDVEAFAMDYWRLDEVQGKKLLDIGCGPGWLTVMYAKHGANVTAIDLTSQALVLTKAALEVNLVSASLEVASAEQLPFPDKSFDVVVSSGVLHHTPDYQKAISESYRVTRDGGTGLITLYRLGVLHSPLIFPIVKTIMRMSRTRHPGANLAATSQSIEEFVRQYDGAANPIGIAKREDDWVIDLEAVGWKVNSVERHYFPARMVPLFSHAPRWFRRFLDLRFATMVYFNLKRE
ncbi:MAG: class I SAM-dependent methyltransferase [Proteobacteria bacterium]|nr:class I SAM-dependent methyltransferase [Pseudomonadota bacterium]